MFLQEYYVSRDDTAKQQVMEAHKFFYRNSMFVLPLHGLGDFIRDRLGNREAVAVEQLIERITMHVNDLCKLNRVDRQHFSRFTNSFRIDIDLWAGDLMNGMDLTRQLIIKEMKQRGISTSTRCSMTRPSRNTATEISASARAPYPPSILTTTPHCR